MNADRQLLFGLLALQNGLIDQARLVAAFHAWSLDRSRGLSEHLVAMGHLDDDDRAAVDALVGRHLKKHGGDAEKSLAAIPAGKSTRERLAALADTDLNVKLSHAGCGSAVTDGDADRTTTYAVGASSADAMRFRVLRPHAQGGLGAVFVALDGELHREVALKQILDAHADDPNSRQRFLLEAEITGGLEHPGIVPVYGLGAYADGRPYYAMRFIRGDSLKQAIDGFHRDVSLKTDPGRRSLELRTLLRRFTDVCNAIEYAHSRGVLHRDIKPGNVIVGKHGETLVVDWGLARAKGRADDVADTGETTLIPSSASGSSETLPGQAMGTPAYMSPEQARGNLDALGPRSDVYSLGATLSCVLTGKAPFEGDVVDVIRKVQAGELTPPRKVDSSIDPALEAVCLKAMALKPADRYASCRALAEDVERWAADEPVSAYPEPSGRRARRWAKRNRTAVTAAVVALVASLAGLGAVAAVQTQAKAALAAKNLELTRANALVTKANTDLAAANAKVEARFNLAREAIRSFQDGVNEDDMLKGSELKGLRNKLLRSAAGFYEKLEKLLQGQSDRASRAILAQSYFELGELTEKIGIRPEALAVHRKAMAIRRELATGPDADATAKLDLARSLNVAGVLSHYTGDSAGALSAFEEARDRAAPLADAPGAPDAARDVFGISNFRIGWLHSLTGKPAEGLESYRRALAIRRKLADDNPTVTEFRGRLADSYHNIGVLQSDTGQTAEALDSFRRALAIQQKLADDNPAVTGFQIDLAYSHNNIGLVQMPTGHTAEALESCRRALAIQRKLVDDHPAVTEFRNLLAVSHNYIGFLQRETGQTAKALDSFRRALAIQQKLADDNPAVTRFRSDLAQSHNYIGVVQSETGQTPEALESNRRALAIRQKLADDNPAVTRFRHDLADSFLSIGSLRLNSGQLAEAVEEFAQEAAIREKLAGDNPSFSNYRKDLANCLNNTTVLFLRLGRPSDARARSERAVALLEALARDDPMTTRHREHLAEGYLRFGQVREAEGDAAGAAADWSRAIALFQAIPGLSGEFTFVHGCCRASLARLAGNAGAGISLSEGETEAAKAIALLRRAVATGYRDPSTYRNETALDPLRNREDFKLLMMDLAMPKEPFARAAEPARP
jgi:eukaryotic-like serine/threonine-protein kinase